MKFASLLKIHQNKQVVPSYPNNQYLVNCNQKFDQPIIYAPNNYSGIKKRPVQPMEPLNQKLCDIYQSYQQNPHTQWILELQAHRVRIHKFQPSKYKSRKDEPIVHDQQIYPKTAQNHQRAYQPQHQQDQVEPSHKFALRQNQQMRKNYSPMQKIRPKTFGREQNWMQNLNQNKFSFGQDSIHALNEVNDQNQQNKYQTQSHDNKSYIEERNEYELPPNDVSQKPKSYCVNLMNEFDRCDQFMDDLRNDNEREASKRTLNQLANLEEKKKGYLQQPIEQQNNPDSRIDFNPNVGFSFEEIDKICQPTQNTIGPVSDNKFQLKSENQVLTTQNAIISVRQATTKNEENRQKTVEKQSLPRETSLKKIIDDVEKVKIISRQQQEQSSKKIEIKPISNPPSQTKQKQSSPHRIYCKANIRNLTPQKFKYPRVDSKIETNTEVRPFLSETQTKSNKIETMTARANTEKKLENESQKQMITVPSSERLLALIDESKRLLESRTVNEEVKCQDRIRRIVLYQTTAATVENNHKFTETPQPKQIETTENRSTLQNVQKNQTTTEAKQPKITIIEPKQVDQRSKKQSELTPKKREIQFQAVSSPKSPVQQKPKFHNQLANMQTNYTPQKTNQTSSRKYSQSKPVVNTATNPSPKQFSNTNNVQQVSAYNKTQIESNNLTTTHAVEQQQQNYFQSNYAYKPMNVPQYNNRIKPVEQKDLSGYKVPQYPSNTQISNQPYQPIINTYQQLNEAAYQTQKNSTSPQVYPYTSTAPTKTYSPYFPVNNININKPTVPNQPSQTRPSTTTAYQTYTYSNFPSSNQPQMQPSTQPLNINNNNNYIKINANYISPMDKYEQKPQQKDLSQNQFNLDWKQKENLKPPVGLGIEGIKCVESKIYDPSSNRLTTMQQDPKESSVEFSLRIQEHFHIGNK